MKQRTVHCAPNIVIFVENSTQRVKRSWKWQINEYGTAIANSNDGDYCFAFHSLRLLKSITLFVIHSE